MAGRFLLSATTSYCSRVHIHCQLNNTNRAILDSGLFLPNKSPTQTKLRAVLSGRIAYYSTSAKPEQKKQRKENINVGTIGHVDHGKTTLTAAITQVLSEKSKKIKSVKYEEIDRAPEEKRRGITINIAHIGYETAKRRYAHTDCPGHKDFIKNMILGTSQMDTAILVLAATEGAMPQTKEHIMLAKQIGVESIVVYMNKADLADAEMLELGELEIRELLAEHGFDADSIPVVKGSALCALEGVRPEIGTKSVEELLSVLDSLPSPSREIEGGLIMPVEAGFTVTGRGTVIVGTLERGSLKRGEKVDMVGFGPSVKTIATEIHVFKNSVPEATAGDHVGVLCRGLKVSDVRKGKWMVPPGTETVHNSFKAEIYVLTETEGGKDVGIPSGSKDRMICTTWEQLSKLTLEPGRDLVMPGEYASVWMTLLRPLPLIEGLKFTLRVGKDTRAAGRISQILPNVPVHNIDHLLKYEPKVD